ncbi:MAG: tetratricopeptide repeat protein [Sedimentisphaerales bacterium]
MSEYCNKVSSGENEFNQISVIFQPMRRKRNKLYVISIYVALALATIIAYEPVRHNSFVNFDDDSYVTENPKVKEGISRESILWAFTTPYADNWHPLTWLSHMLDCRLFGLNAPGHHLVSLFFHVANTLLLFFVLKKMTGAIWPTAFVAAAFALHPLHVESVAWVAERKDVLSAFFWMLTMIAYVRYVQKLSIGRYLLVVLALCLGLMAKPMVVTLPFVLLLLDYWPLGRAAENVDRRSHQAACTRFQWPVFYRLVGEKIPFFVLSAVSSVITFLIQRSSGAVTPMDRLPAGSRIANAFISYIGYIGKIFWPRRLAVLYPHPTDKVLMWQTVISVLLLLAISICVVRLAQKHKYLLVGWLWYLGTLVPVIGLVQVGSQAMADRYTYLPSIGIFIIVAWGAAALLPKWRYRKIVLGITAVAVLAVLLICTRIQVGYWKDGFTLFGHALEVTENNSIMHNNLGGVLFRDKGRLEDAIIHFDEALRINPQYPNALSNKAKVLLAMGKTDEAIAVLNELLCISGRPYEVYNILGLVYAQKGEVELAIENYNEALKLKPDYVEVMNNLGSALEEQGKVDDAIKQWEKVLKLKPDYVETHYSMGLAMAEQGKYDDAIKHFSNALQAKPDWAEAHYNLGGVYVRQGKLELAVEQCVEALRLKPDYLTARVSLAHTLLELGRVRPAIEQYYEILRLKPDAPETLNRLGWLLAITEDASVQNSSEAVKFAQRACELTGFEQAELLDTLAAAYAAAGRFSEAIETAQSAVRSAESNGKKELAEEIQKRLELYKAGRPYHEK